MSRSDQDGGRIAAAHRRPPAMLAGSRNDSRLVLRYIYIQLPRERGGFISSPVVKTSHTGDSFREHGIFIIALPQRSRTRGSPFYPRLSFFHGTPRPLGAGQLRDVNTSPFCVCNLTEKNSQKPQQNIQNVSKDKVAVDGRCVDMYETFCTERKI